MVYTKFADFAGCEWTAVLERLLDDFPVPELGELRLNEPAIRRNREAKR